MIKVSIIVPVYNAEKYIDRCVNCLLGQTLEGIEIIFVNDASLDKSGEVLERWREKYQEKIRVIHSEINRGAGGARNLGIELAQGEYIGFVDCDDVVDEIMYEKLYQKAVEEDCDIVDCAYYEESTDITALSYADSVTGELNDEKRSSIIAGVGYAVTKIFRTSLLKNGECRIREGVIYEDLDFLIKATLLAKRIGNVKYVLYYYKDNEQSSSNTNKEQKKFDDMVAALNAIDILEFEGNLHMAMEYAMLSCFACAVGICLLNQENQEFKLIENIKSLKKMSTGRWNNWRENIYVQKNMPEENREILGWFEGIKL